MKDKELIDKTGQWLIEHEQTVSVAESVTSGMLQTALSAAKDAELFFQGGITTYNIGQKHKHLNVDPIHALKCNCVSQQVANTMAKNACLLFNSHWGIGITGYAAPVQESGMRMFAFYSIVHDGSTVAAGELDSKTEEGPDTQRFYVSQILLVLFRHLFPMHPVA